jgi:large exoprotein involved in heme utilization and adhesion
LGSVLSQAGNIEIDATEQVTIEGGRIVNNVNFGAFGNAGNIVINTGSLDANNAAIGSATFGQGNTGSVTIQARDAVSFSGSNVLSIMGEQGIGNGADINIQTRSLSLSNGTILGSGTLGQGNSGNIQINASDSISVSSGSILQAFTNGKGNAGNVIIQSGGTVSFDGRGDHCLPSVVASFVGANAVGDGGNVNIQAKTVSLSNGAQIVTSTLGQRNAGSIQINASDSIFVSGSSLQTLSLGEGNAGNIIIQSGNAVSLDGVGADIFLSKLYGITLADLPTTFAGLSNWFSFIGSSVLSMLNQRLRCQLSKHLIR